MVRETSPRPKLRPEGFGVSEQTERMLEPEGDPVSPTEVMKTGLTEEVMGKAQDYVDNPPPEPKKDPLAFATEKGYVKAIKGPEEKEKYISNLNVGTEEGNQTVRKMFENILGKNPDWDPLLVNWCATFVSDVLDNLGADPLKTNDRYDRLRARKYVKYGSPVERKNIQQGDIVVLDFPRDSEGNITFGPGGKRDGVGDHVTFYVGNKSSANKDGSGYIGVLGGNQGYNSEIGIAEYPEENILAVRRITYDDVDYEFTEALAKDNPNFKAFLKKEGEGFDMKSLEENPMSPSNTPMTSRPQGFDEGGLAENDNLALARAYGVEPVDLDETVESVKAVGQFALESLPGVGTAFTVAEIEDELKKEEPNYLKIGMLVGTEAIGLIPGLGTAAKSMIRKGADMARQTDEVMDAASNIPKVSRTSNVDKEKALAMIESQELRNAWVSNKRKELGISDTDKDYSSRDLVSKQEVKRRQTRKFPEQIKALEEDRMSGPEYRRYIRENQPATKFTKEDVEGMLTSFEDMVGGLDALGQNKASKGIIGLTDDVEVGAEVAARLDIPAYNKRDIWVAQITGGGKNMYGRTAVLKNVKFFIEGKDPARKSKKMRDVGKGEKDKSPFATMKGEWQGLSDDEAFEKALSLMDDPEWIQVGFNPERHSFFYDKDTMMPVFEAEEVIQVGPLVLAKKAKLGDKRIDPETGKESSYVPAERIKKIRELKIEDKPGKPTVFNQGGVVMNEQMEMAFMAEGGLRDDGLSVDPVSGNDIPNGSMAEEVRDDIPAQLSEGEYVVPADVVRFYGVKFFEDLREEAKRGLAEMESNGRIGGEPVPEGGPQVNEAPVTEQEMAALRELAMEMNVGGMVPSVNPNMQPPPQAVGNAAPQQPQMMNKGGTVLGFDGGGDLSAVQSQPITGGGLGFSLFGPSTNDGSLPTSPFEEGQIVELYKDGKVLSFVMMRDYQAYLDKIEEGWLTKEQKDAKIAEEGPTIAGTDTTTTTTTDDKTASTTDSSDDRTDYRQFTTQTKPTLTKNVSDMTDDELKVALEGMNIVGRTGSTLAYTMGLPVGALVGSQLASNYNNMLEVARDRKLISEKEYADKRKGSIFGGEKSLFDNLIDRSDKNKELGTSNKKGIDFGDTWLGDLLGFDGKAGVQGPSLSESFGGARRDQTALTPSSTYAAPTTGATAPGDMGDGLRGPGSTSTAPATQAEKTAAAKSATDDWVAATQAAQSTSTDDPNWGAAIKAQSEASKAATKAIQEASGWSGGFFGSASNPNWRDAAAEGGLMSKNNKKKKK